MPSVRQRRNHRSPEANLPQARMLALAALGTLNGLASEPAAWHLVSNRRRIPRQDSFVTVTFGDANTIQILA